MLCMELDDLPLAVMYNNVIICHARVRVCGIRAVQQNFAVASREALLNKASGATEAGWAPFRWCRMPFSRGGWTKPLHLRLSCCPPVLLDL